jgi:tetratricopeptide (TPR) repeat protein
VLLWWCCSGAGASAAGASCCCAGANATTTTADAAFVWVFVVLSGCRCQLAGWTEHKKLCVTPVQLVERVALAISTEIPAAQERWDSATVIKVGLRTVDDLERCVWKSQDLSDSLTVDLHEQLGRAYSRSGLFTAAAHHFGLASLACVRIEKFARQGLILANKADMQFKAGDFGAALETFAKVENLGEKGGVFDLYARACLGRSRCAAKSGDGAAAMLMAQESLKATGCLLDNQFGKNRMEASALLCICTLSDMHADDFDEKLLNRLLELGAAIEADPREGGTTLHIYALELVARRHLSVGRLGVGVAAYKHVLHLVADPRFAQMEDIQHVGKMAKEMLAEVQFFGLA